MSETAAGSEVPQRHLFGTDGVRGIANTELSPSLVMALGAAAAQVLRESSTSREIVVGRDPRISGDLLQAALVAGIASQGMNVVLLGVLPTPGVAYLTQARNAAAGVMISASHNPVEDNGIKFFGANGRKLSDALEARIEAAMQNWETVERPCGGEVGRVREVPEAVQEYADHLAETMRPRQLDGLRLIVDGANGAAAYLAPVVLGGLGAEVVPVSCYPNGVNINAECGSLHPEDMARRVVAEEAFAGMAFDGDADRVILADNQGRIFDGDRILYAAGVWLHRQGELPGSTVVGTIMSNMGLEVALQKQGVRLVRAAVGDRYVAEQMREHGAVLGGEKSGHILFSRYSTTGDGILTALQILRLCCESGRSLAEWSDEVEEYPQELLSVRVRDRNAWKTNERVQQAIQQAEQQLGDRGRINVRPSGTEKKVRVMVEGPERDEVAQLARSVADVIAAELGPEAAG
ncbi:MAG: phosphoglucosamine mutase [Armatimonadaceae bacterium]